MKRVGQWLVLGALSGVLSGLASALFLWLLDRATAFRGGHSVLVFALPVAGLAMGWLYERFGKPVEKGTSLVITRARDGGDQVPVRMAPMVLIGTVLTHLFGGSAGREGTAVQMGASLTDWLSHRFRVDPEVRRALLLAGVAGGFGSVFGTPIAGAVFAMEFVVPNRFQWRSAVPIVIASFVGDFVTRACGIEHTAYPRLAEFGPPFQILWKWAVFAVAVCAVTVVFIELTHAIKSMDKKVRLPVRMAIGGVAVIALWQLVGTDDYLGLGVPTIVRAFSDPSIPPWMFALKLVFTAVTIGAGFLGGEVTPLFFIGATLGNALAHALGLPIDLAAAVGMAAVFGVASNAPVALAIMAAELVGPAVLPHALVVCVLAHVLNFRRSTIYAAQREGLRP